MMKDVRKPKSKTQNRIYTATNYLEFFRIKMHVSQVRLTFIY